MRSGWQVIGAGVGIVVGIGVFAGVEVSDGSGLGNAVDVGVGVGCSPFGVDDGSSDNVSVTVGWGATAPWLCPSISGR